MLHPVENRMMTDFIPAYSSAGGLKSAREVEASHKTENSTAKDGGREEYVSIWKDESEAERKEKEYLQALKEEFQGVTEIQLKKTQKIRRQLTEFGPELVYLMIDYWSKKTGVVPI
jgi:hypothetical protein